MTEQEEAATLPTPERLAEWWVLMNCWEWPHDLPGKPNPPGGMTSDQQRYALRGAHTVLSLFVPEDEQEAAWKRYKAILAEHESGSKGES